MNAPLAPYLTVGGNYKVVLTALDPTSGAVVGGVTISSATISIDREAGSSAPPFTVLPPYTQGGPAV